MSMLGYGGRPEGSGGATATDSYCDFVRIGIGDASPGNPRMRCDHGSGSDKVPPLAGGIRMRLVFADPESGEVPLRPGALTLGASGECDIPLAGAGWLPHHASIIVDPQRGLWLQLEPGAAMAHVNARPVRECAMLRAGDIVSLAACSFRSAWAGRGVSVEQPPPPRNCRACAGRPPPAWPHTGGAAGHSGLHRRTFLGTMLLGSGAGFPSDRSARHAAAFALELHRDRIVRAPRRQAMPKVNGLRVESDPAPRPDHRGPASLCRGVPACRPWGGSFRPRQRPITQAVPPPAREERRCGGQSPAPPSARPESRFHAWRLLLPPPRSRWCWHDPVRAALSRGGPGGIGTCR